MKLQTHTNVEKDLFFKKLKKQTRNNAILDLNLKNREEIRENLER